MSYIKLSKKKIFFKIIKIIYIHFLIMLKIQIILWKNLQTTDMVSDY